ncbi:MAG TPA: hypothetical protein VLE93_02785 [Candidatus Saccharimonadales bacterium]|nr:hypothetical protein [Candidatus Saccharimonadales bacterium]
MRQLAILGLIISLILAGCGGGGSSASGNTGHHYDFTPNQALNAPITQGLVSLPGETFSQACSINVTEENAPQLPQSHQIADQPKLTLALPTLPAATITVSYPDSHPELPNLSAAAWFGSRLVGTFGVIRQNGRVIVQLDPERLTKMAGAGPQKRNNSIVISLLLSFLTIIDSPDQSPSLEQVGLETDRSRVAIFTHGLLQQGRDLTPSAQRAQTIANYSAVYVYRYPYDEPVAQAGHDLAVLIRQLNLPAKSAVLWGYSKGALVNLWTLVMEQETATTKQAVFLAGPFEGCRLDLLGLYLFLGTDFFTSDAAVPFLQNPNDNCLAELLPGSDPLSSLMGATGGQHGDVDYYFFAGGSDDVVGPASAQFASSKTAENLTSGGVYRGTIPNRGHLAMDEPDVISTALGQMSEERSDVSVRATVNGHIVTNVVADGTDGSWHYQLVLRNSSSESVTVRSLQMEYYDRYANHTSQDQWYARISGGEVFPTQYVAWNQPLAANQVLDPNISLQTWAGGPNVPVWNYGQDRWALTVHYTVIAIGDQTHRLYKNHWDVGCAYGGVSPVWPLNTRAVQGPATGARPSSTQLSH